MRRMSGKPSARATCQERSSSGFNNIFIALDTTRDLSLFDIKKLKSSNKRTYYRVRKGKYRAIFYIEEGNYFVISIAKREEVYDTWE